MTLILSNEDVEKLLTMENCMDALEYAYGELGRDRAVMGPVIRVISPVMAGQTAQGWQTIVLRLFLHGGGAAGTGCGGQPAGFSTCSTMSQPRQGFGLCASRLRLGSAFAG